MNGTPPSVSPPPTCSRVHVECLADLTLSNQDRSVKITSAEDGVRLGLRSLADGRAFLREISPRSRRQLAPVVLALVKATGRDLRVQVGDHTVATFGEAERGGMLERLLGVWPLRVRWGALARRVLGRSAR